MCTLPSFLFPLLDLNGPWDMILEYLYDLFERDFKNRALFYENLKLVYDTRLSDDNKEMAFWHLITKEDKKLGRIPDYYRAKRIHWNRPIIENHSDPAIKEWNYLEGSGRIRKYLWLEKHDFCIILEIARNRHIIILVTAFYVEQFKKRDLKKKYQNRISSA